jgi:hypothetical protein
MTFDLQLDSRDESEVARSEVGRIWSLGDGWNLVIPQEVLRCEGVTGCIVMLQDPIASPFFRPLPSVGAHHMFQNLGLKLGIHRVPQRDKQV